MMVTMMIHTWETLTSHLACTKKNIKTQRLQLSTDMCITQCAKQAKIGNNYGPSLYKDSSECDAGLTGLRAVWMNSASPSHEHPIGADTPSRKQMLG